MSERLAWQLWTKLHKAGVTVCFPAAEVGATLVCHSSSFPFLQEWRWCLLSSVHSQLSTTTFSITSGFVGVARRSRWYLIIVHFQQGKVSFSLNRNHVGIVASLPDTVKSRGEFKPSFCGIMEDTRVRLVSFGIDVLMTAAMSGYEPRYIGGPRGLGGPLMTSRRCKAHTVCRNRGQPSKKISWEELWLTEDLSQAVLTQ